MTRRQNLLGTIVAIGVATVALRADVPTDPPVFTNPLVMDNPYDPFVVGRTKFYEVLQGHTDTEVVEIYLPDVRDFMWDGMLVSCHTLQEMEIEDGEVAEISWNYFAQGDDGTVYYFGEVVDNYEDGVVVDHDGSWLVGGPTLPGDPPDTVVAVDPTIFMPGNPEVGDVFKPEDLFPFVDETDEILKVEKTVSVPAGHFVDCIKIEESSLLSEDTEIKWYAPGMGVVKVKESGEILVLVEVIDA